MLHSLLPAHALRGRLRPRLLVLALLAAGSAHAQSSVQAYGLIDMSVGQFQMAGATKSKGIDSGNMTTSYIGFKGSEDLGGGLAAKFAVESFLRADTGAPGRFGGDLFWARNAFVGVGSNSLGSVTLGRNTTSLFVSTLLFNAFGDSFGFSPSIRHYFAGGGVGAVIGDTGWSDSVAYYSPKFGGLSFSAIANANDTTTGTGRNYSGQALYFSGPFAATVVYQQVKNYTSVFGIATPTAGLDKQGTGQVGASYDFGPVKLFAQYGQAKTTATVDTKAKLADVGASVPIGAGKLLAQYGRTKYTGGLETTLKTLTLGYDYDMSKRTDLYAVYMNDKKTAVDTGNSFAVGVRHRF